MWRLVYPGAAFLIAGIVSIVVMLRVAPPWQDPGGASVFISGTLLLFAAVAWMAHRLWRTIGADRDRKANTLRQGILVSREGMLVRLMPNRCYPIPLERFLEATTWKGEDNDYLRINTSDGFIDLEEDHLTVDAAAINDAVAAFLPHRPVRSKKRRTSR
jgi:hypothetical protein